MNKLRVGPALLMGAIAVGAMANNAARGDVLLDQTNVVGAAALAASSQYAFSVSGAASVTLTDFGAPAAFAALQLAVASSDALVGAPVSVDPSTHKATLAIPAAGNYVLYVVGTPDSTQGFGSFGVCVALTSATGSCVAQYSNTLATPSTPSSTPASTLQTSFTSKAAGTYTVTLFDDAFPAALQSISAGVLQGSTPIAVNIPAGTATQVTLAAATTFELLAAANAGGQGAGLYGIRITDPTGAAVFDHSYPVGTLAAATVVDNPTAQTLTLRVSDYAYPAPLTSVGSAVTSGGALLGSVDAAGAQLGFASPAGSLDVWTYAVAGTEPGVYGVELAGSKTLLSLNNVLNPASASSSSSYAFVVNIPTAGTYQLSVSDFAFPNALTSVSGTVAQNGKELTQNSTGKFTAAAGLAVVVVTVVPPQRGSGIFDVSVGQSGSTALLDQTQAVGGVFTTQTVNLGTTGGYSVTLADLGFPQAFENLAVVVSQAGQVLGKIYSAGTFEFTGTPGAQYLVTFVATPDTAAASAGLVAGYGLYSLNISSAAPTVTLSASPTSVTSGSTSTLTWSSTNATSCTASGGSGWGGSEATGGSLAVSIAATETLTLTCTGPGGEAAQSVAVTATKPPSTSSGGGGSFDLELMSLLAALVVARRGRFRATVRR